MQAKKRGFPNALIWLLQEERALLKHTGTCEEVMMFRSFCQQIPSPPSSAPFHHRLTLSPRSDRMSFGHSNSHSHSTEVYTESIAETSETYNNTKVTTLTSEKVKNLIQYVSFSQHSVAPPFCQQSHSNVSKRKIQVLSRVLKQIIASRGPKALTPYSVDSFGEGKMTPLE